MAEMLQHSEIMRKVQQELDEVVGNGSIVEESHIPKLHFLQSVVKETLRLHPPLPLLVPHCPVESCTVGGYTIPKGSRVFVNVWSMHRDPEAWQNPLEFHPERFLKELGKFEYQGTNFRYLPFGSGRRICAGISLAEKMVAYVLATVLHSFEWELPQAMSLDFADKFGIVLKKSDPLVAIPTARLSTPELYH